MIDTIRVWTVPGVNATDPEHLGDFYQDVRLYFGGEEGGVTPSITGLLKPGSDQTSNPNILIADATGRAWFLMRISEAICASGKSISRN